MHPEFKDGCRSVEANYAVNGRYWIWAQGQTRKDKEEFSISQIVLVRGGSVAHALPPKLEQKLKAIDGGSVAVLSSGELKSGQPLMLDLKLSRSDQKSPKISPFLGAMAHVILVDQSGSELLHVHPMPGNSKTTLMLHTEFPYPGQYRVWAQFLDDGKLRTVALALNVN